jgi:hypothetical protein
MTSNRHVTKIYFVTNLMKLILHLYIVFSTILVKLITTMLKVH